MFPDGRIHLVVTDDRRRARARPARRRLGGLAEHVVAADGTLESGAAVRGGSRATAELLAQTPVANEWEHGK